MDMDKYRKYDAVRSGIVWTAVVLIVFIMFTSFSHGCEQSQMTRRDEIKLEQEKVKAGYERTQTNSVKVGQ